MTGGDSSSCFIILRGALGLKTANGLAQLDFIASKSLPQLSEKQVNIECPMPNKIPPPVSHSPQSVFLLLVSFFFFSFHVSRGVAKLESVLTDSYCGILCALLARSAAVPAILLS